MRVKIQDCLRCLPLKQLLQPKCATQRKPYQCWIAWLKKIKFPIAFCEGSGVLLRCEKPVRWGLINETSQHNPTSNQSCP